VLLCVGLLVVGPVVAVVGAVGAGYVAATHGGEAGEVARATGRAATTAYTKAKEYDREHHVSTTPWKPHSLCPSGPAPSLLALPLCVYVQVSERVKEGVTEAVHKAQDFNEKHHVSNPPLPVQSCLCPARVLIKCLCCVCGPLGDGEGSRGQQQGHQRRQGGDTHNTDIA
jgi:hypothetical protein